jgi:hypothetical protein
MLQIARIAILWSLRRTNTQHVLPCAVGYGSSNQGDYWLIRNSWSDLWGDRGFIKISQDRHGCGVPTDTMYAVVDEDAL